MKIYHLEDKNFNEKVSQYPICIVYFFIPDTAFCQNVDKKLKEALSIFGSEIKVFKVNIETSLKAECFHINSIPTIIFFLRGKVYKIYRFLPSPQEIIQTVEDMKTSQATQNIKLAERIKQAIDSEQVLSQFYSYISSITKNGKVKKMFGEFAQEAQQDKKFLEKFLFNLNGEILSLTSKKICSRVGCPESFSLIGAINMASSLEKRAIEFYKEMLSFAKDDSFKKIIKRKKLKVQVLKKEEKFIKTKKILEKFDIEFERKVFDGLFKG